MTEIEPLAKRTKEDQSDGSDPLEQRIIILPIA